MVNMHICLSYISYCDGQHSTLVQFVLMLSVNHSLAKARPTMRCIRLVLITEIEQAQRYFTGTRQYMSQLVLRSQMTKNSRCACASAVQPCLIGNIGISL